jgi:PTS system N-acetylglucosamine-specific IIC component
MPVGILSGLIAGYCYNRFSEIRLPSYLAFFAGRRFVPIMTGFIGVLVAVAFGYGWPALAQGMDALSRGVVNAGSLGLFVYGALNRVLIVTGLHHILNNIAWFLLGDYHGVTGDLKRFFAGDPSAGAFMSGFFPVMMFGLPGACLAMYHAVVPERRRAVGGLLLSLGLTAFLTGVTEPVEFTFMFLAPVLYGVHAVLTGLSMVLMHLLGVHLGFGFSAGLFDYLLNFSKAQKPLLLLPIGAAYFATYYFLFRYGIRRLNLATPGREPQVAEPAAGGDAATATGSQAARFVAALGGAGNLRSVDACTTRLRLVVVDSARVDGAALARLGSMGVVRPAPTAAQVVLGPVADQVAGDIRRHLQNLGGSSAGTATPAAPAAAAPAAVAVAARGEALAIEALLAALGGRGNVRAVEVGAGRLLVQLVKGEALQPSALSALAPRGYALTRSAELQLLIGSDVERTAAALRSALAG